MFSFQLDYPPTSENQPRYTRARRPEAIERALAARVDVYREVLASFAAFFPALSEISCRLPPESDEPSYINGYLPGLDCVALYSLLAENHSRHYLEVGSGNSTKFARRSIRDNALPTKIMSIDPHPRAEIDHLCDDLIRQPLEEVDLTVVDRLEANDILFIDNSHRCFMNSDVTVCFLEILPRLKRGVLVQIHDIFWPEDYPADWAERFYNEQYLLGTLLANGCDNFEIVLPCYYVSGQATLNALIEPLWNSRQELTEVERHGGSFWMRKL